MLTREKFNRQLEARGLTALNIFNGYASLTEVVVPALIPPTILADPDDDHVLACAIAAQADYIVSGDRHLLALEQFKNITIVTAARAVQFINTGE